MVTTVADTVVTAEVRGKFEVIIQDVDGLGAFVEIEQLPHETQEQLVERALSLDIPMELGDLYVSIPYLLYQKRNF